MIILCSNVTTPVGGGATSGPHSSPATPMCDTGLELEPDSDCSSAERAMERASVGCLWWRRERACTREAEGGWSWQREEMAAVRHLPARVTSSWTSPLISSEVMTGEHKEGEEGGGREGGKEGGREKGKGGRKGGREGGREGGRKKRKEVGRNESGRKGGREGEEEGREEGCFSMDYMRYTCN